MLHYNLESTYLTYGITFYVKKNRSHVSEYMSLRTSGLLKYSVCCKIICKLLFPVILAPKITNLHYVNVAMYECYVPILNGTYINNVCFSSQKYVLRKTRTNNMFIY